MTKSSKIDRSRIRKIQFSSLLDSTVCKQLNPRARQLAWKARSLKRSSRNHLYHKMCNQRSNQKSLQRIGKPFSSSVTRQGCNNNRCRRGSLDKSLKVWLKVPCKRTNHAWLPRFCKIACLKHRGFQ